MPHSSRALLAAAALAACGVAHAATTLDLGIASRFSAITFGDFTGYTGDTGSLLGVGGNATLTNWTVNDYNLPGVGGYSFIAGGNLAATDGHINGSTAVGGGATTTAFAHTGPIATGASATLPLNFTELETQLKGASSTAAAAASTGTVSYNTNNSAFLAGTNSDVEVFSLDGGKLSGGSYLEGITGIKDHATVILNISGQDVSMGSFGFNFPDNGLHLNLLLNFYQATSLSFSSIAVEGAVLAPLADVTGSSGHIGGTFVAKSFASVGDGHFEFHDINFNPVVIPSAVPEPQTWALLLAGAGCLTWSRRRTARGARTA